MGQVKSRISTDMAHSVTAVEDILKYRFKNKKLLEEALTHSSCKDSASYERLEFVGDAVLDLAFTNFIFLSYPSLDPGQLTSLRIANTSTEKLARVALRCGLHNFLRHNAEELNDQVRISVAVTSFKFLYLKFLLSSISVSVLLFEDVCRFSKIGLYRIT